MVNTNFVKKKKKEVAPQTHLAVSLNIHTLFWKGITHTKIARLQEGFVDNNGLNIDAESWPWWYLRSPHYPAAQICGFFY